MVWRGTFNKIKHITRLIVMILVPSHQYLFVCVCMKVHAIIAWWPYTPTRERNHHTHNECIPQQQQHSEVIIFMSTSILWNLFWHGKVHRGNRAHTYLLTGLHLEVEYTATPHIFITFSRWWNAHQKCYTICDIHVYMNFISKGEQRRGQWGAFVMRV